jgi:hypothetical protein
MAAQVSINESDHFIAGGCSFPDSTTLLAVLNRKHDFCLLFAKYLYALSNITFAIYNKNHTLPMVLSSLIEIYRKPINTLSFAALPYCTSGYKN